MAKRKPLKSHGLVPAAARIPKQALAPLRPTHLVLDSITAYELSIGGRRKLIEALAAAPALPPDLHRVFALVADPENQQEPLAALCARAKVSPGDLFAAFSAAAKAMEEIVAMAKAARALPDAIDDVATYTVPQTSTCPQCKGLTTIVPKPTKKVPNPEPEECPSCFGAGTLTRPSSLDHQRLLFEYTGQLKKAGLAINTQVNVDASRAGGSTPGGSLEQLQQAVGEILYGRAPQPPVESSAAVDAEIVPPKEA